MGADRQVWLKAWLKQLALPQQPQEFMVTHIDDAGIMDVEFGSLWSSN
jgi:hypothetical protein